MELTEEQRKELQLFIDKWKQEIPDEEIYFSFNGHGHLRYINANDVGLVRFGVKNIEAALSDKKYINISGEYLGENWIKQEEEDLSIHYIEKINKDIGLYIESRGVNKKAAVRNGKLIGPLIIAILFAVPTFFIYLFIFWLNH
ncbi:hypothetical protein [Solitalea canadensis]|uniref:Uncharacterized protein n=1 Tax=Solitalea canadensis (strain ATCC 29591 / DSM 3403 / JCM 21819 / LMG 8368 / NBRC 15130 / NCIMB 12057 / USAM 9D) TaxID=929556 RepID=H8KPW0_SOLCM|nr:hypothetical protein [Solitalea canadensis]AFD06069.1 hypothetical protein Solca_0957 [Solitalea canadensis DSM 3403]